MNRLIFTIGILFMVGMPSISGAATTSPYPNPYRQTMWNDITDTIHTAGQTPQQAQTTLKKLHNTRNRTRIKSINAANRAKYIAKRKAWVNS
jgi:hypothetical protein